MFIVTALAIAIPTAKAGETASGDQIKTAISGNTVDGVWHETSPYSTYFAPDGALKGSYAGGKWFVLDDTLCFETNGVEASCWQVKIVDSFISWIHLGEVLGNGSIVTGNPRGY